MIRIGLSTSCVWPHGVEHACRMARLAGYDGVEVMVTGDKLSHEAGPLLELSAKYELPIMAIHAPVLLLTSYVWGRDPEAKLRRSGELAAAVGADSVVVHPPFRWQSEYAAKFERIIRETATDTGVEMAVENMFPWKIAGRNLKAYAPSSDPLDLDVDSMTLDFSHASLAGRDSLEFAMAMGDRLRHIHLCDGTRSVDEGMIFDEHLPPGRGTQPVAETLAYLASRNWSGSIVAEVITRKAKSERERLDVLIETAAFAREHLRQPHETREPLPIPDDHARASRRRRRAESAGRD